MQIDRKVTQPYMGVWPRVGEGPSHSGDRTFSWVYGSDPCTSHSNIYLFHYKITQKWWHTSQWLQKLPFALQKQNQTKNSLSSWQLKKILGSEASWESEEKQNKTPRESLVIAVSTYCNCRLGEGSHETRLENVFFTKRLIMKVMCEKELQVLGICVIQTDNAGQGPLQSQNLQNSIIFCDTKQRNHKTVTKVPYQIHMPFHYDTTEKKAVWLDNSH